MKRSIKLVLMLIVLVVASAGLLLTRNAQQQSVVNEEEGRFALTEHTAQEITGLSWINDEESYHFVKEDNEWHNADSTSFPTNQESVQALADKIVGLEGTRRMEDVQSPEDYGLGKDAFSLSVEWTDGSETTYIMGNSTPFDDGYYLQLNEDANTVYTIESDLSWSFDVSLASLAELETIPQPKNVSRVVIGSDLDASRQENSITLNPNQHWYDSESGEALQDDLIESLSGDIQEIVWSSLVEVDATDEQLASWNLDGTSAKTLTLYDGDDEALSLMIGAADDNGDYYAKLANSNMVYTVAADSVEALLEIEPDSLRVTDLIPLDQSDLQEAVFRTSDNTWTVIREETEVQAEEGSSTSEAAEAERADSASDEESYVSLDESTEETEGSNEPEVAVRITVNDKAAELDVFDSLWLLVRNITITGHVDVEHGDAPLLTIAVVNESGIHEEFEFYAYNVNSYTVVCSDGRTLQVSADAIDRIIRNLNQL
ncbi:MAG: DUF4340 domain-containing protein [Clostridia bacterium]|nr:DUF4340 domain-containing protein [Clostridia bacterium]MBQ8962841.1 DUF4340 domain-containing protein [Clostridia bacterium]